MLVCAVIRLQLLELYPKLVLLQKHASKSKGDCDHFGSVAGVGGLHRCLPFIVQAAALSCKQNTTGSKAVAAAEEENRKMMKCKVATDQRMRILF